MSEDNGGRIRRLILLVLCTLLVFTATFAYALEQKLPAVEQGPTASQADVPPGPAVPQQPDVPQAASGRYRFLLCGADDAASLTDVILYGVLDTNEDRLELLQIPRDIFVGDEYPSGKINAVCNSGETQPPVLALCQVLEQRFCLPVDHYVVVTLETVRDVVDSLGGITVDVPQQIDYLPGKVLEPGVQTLNGEQAEWLIRYRKGYVMGDLGRLQTQQLFLQAMMQAISQQSDLRLALLAARYFDKIETDVSLTEGLGLAYAALQVGVEKAEIHTIEGYGAQYGAYTVMIPYRQKLTDLLNEHFRTQQERVEYLPLASLPQEAA